jgi:hypothetical protein
MTEPMPRSEAPRRINGATEVGKSMPPASPQAATSAPERVIESTLASVVEPIARPARFSQRFCRSCELFAFDDLARAQAFLNNRPAPAARSRP